METDTIEPFTWIEPYEKLQKISRFELPVINDRIETGHGCVYEISSTTINELSSLIVNTDVPKLSPQQATDILRCVAPIISSVHRHLVTFKHKQNHFSQLFPESESFLLQLGKKAGLPPRDSHYTTWILNSNPVYTFDTNPGWMFFWDAVRITNQNNLTAFNILEEITNGYHYITSNRSIELIKEAVINISHTFAFYKRFVKGGMLPEYFADVYRSYFLEYSIGGIKYTGSNATNLASVPALDYKIGVINDAYADTVKNRFQHYTQEDTNFVTHAMQEPSIIQLIVEALGFDFTFFKYAADQEIQASFNKLFLTEQIRLVFAATLNLVHVLSSWSKQHFGLINTYLIKQEQKMQHCPLGHSAPVVSTTHGVGGATHEETKTIRDMRANNEIIRKLKLIFHQ